MSRPPSDAATVTTRFLLLRGMRWLPTGLLVPVLVLVLLERGLTLGEVGLVFAAQGLMVLVLELPTGGLADAIGRKPVLLAASLFEAGAVALLIVADSLLLLAVVAALQGIYRALESGPLDAWYVDSAQALDPGADIERGLARGGVVIGAAIGAGSLLSSLLVAVHPVSGIDPLVTPLVAALGLRVAEFVAIANLVTEAKGRPGGGGLRGAVWMVPGIVASAVGTVRASRVLVSLVVIDFVWGFGMTAFEMFTPAKLETVLDGADRAAALLGPTNAAAWLVAAAGAALVPVLTRRWGAGGAGAALRVAQGLTVLLIALATGPVGVIIAYVFTMGAHGAANPVHHGMLHRAVDDPGSRTTVVSANNLTAQTGGMLGGIALGALATATSLTAAIGVGAAILAAPAPLYLLAGRESKRRQPFRSGAGAG